MSIQIAFSPEDGTLLSAQIAGFDGVDKRIDVLSSVISRKSNIYELTEFEHAYAPPYSSAKDPVNMAGFVAENILSKKLNLFYWDEVSHLENDKVIIDVRSPEEFAKGAIPNAINIPVDEIRSRMGEIPKDKAIRIYCQAGLRGYLAQRILMQNGINDILNLSGGYQLWNACVN
jgi:rhodanese-related sulfurtransferase